MEMLCRQPSCDSWVGSISSILACLICTQARTVLGPCSEQFLGMSRLL